MGSINKQISRYEATAVYTHPDAEVDIVLVHGLNGDPQKTWTAKNGVFWPADLLPTSLREARANVLVYGYNADVYSKKYGTSPSDNFIYMHAQTLVTSLTHYRKDELSSRNPIIWVVHSLGGILLKRALLYSNDLRTSQHEDYRSIYVSTYGVIFLGTPHTGSDVATWGTVLQAMSDAVVPKSFFQSESVLLRTLKRDNETLQNINSHFLDIYQRFKILMAHENHKTDLKGTKMLVVDANSASPQLPGVTYYAIEATHSGMCKFDGKNAPGYRTVAIAIREWVMDASDVIATRWRVEEDEKLARAKHEIEERMKPWINSQRLQSSQGSIPQQNNETTLPPSQDTTSKIDNQSRPLLPEPPEAPNPEEAEESFPSQQSKSDHDSSREPIFVKPTVFRPNTHFKGRERELKTLHKMLMDRQRRSVGTSSVLIQSMPGGGKSHLARQYVFKHKYDYPGGIFWIRAKSIQELEYGYWDIAKTAGLGDNTNRPEQNGFNDSRAMIKAVQAWLSGTDDWLLVLDGIHFDLPDLQHYIPFAKHTSIIYTSTERTPGEDYQFDNPQVIALDSLSKREAQELLFEEMGKKQPWTQDDLRRAEELVELMDRLPLMIHVSALHLKATREPLAKYMRSYRSRPKVGNLPAYRAVREQLEHRGAVAALNLMSILAFFGTHIPVEMIVLGAKALDKRTPVKSTDPETRRTSLNSTFKILIAFALIERNENTEAASAASSRSTRSVDMGQDNLDILRIHGIVQAFFVDVLAEEKDAPFYLERATAVFCQAFDASDRRVEEDPQTGMPEDFRRLLIHGKRLLTHIDRFERRSPDLTRCRELLERRLETIQDRIDQLTRRVADAANQGSAEVFLSVFERTNSLSEADSSTPPSNSSLIENYMLDEASPLESPAIYSPTDHNPYHWHITYPHGEPYTAGDDLERSRTVTPQPAPTEIFESITMPDDDETTRKVFGPNHRTVRRHAERRYRDHAGSWRASPQIVSDPRVSISRETAKGIINPSMVQQSGGPHSSSDSGPTAASEAELSLNQIKRGSPSQRASTSMPDTSAPVNVRPRLIMGRTSYANPKTEEATGDDHPVTPTFSYPAPSSKDAAATIMRLKGTDRPVASVDGLAPIKVSSPLTADPLTTGSLPRPRRPSAVVRYPSTESLPRRPSSVLRYPVNEGEITLDRAARPPSRPPSGPPSRPLSRPSSAHLSRTARSSPSQPTGPFRPPPIPVEVNTSSSLRSPPLPDSRYWTESHGRVLPPGYAIDEDDEYMTHSLPYPNPPYPHTVPMPPPDGFNMAMPDHHPAPWVASPNLHPQGYSSQPMSRDPSHQSSASHGSNRSQSSHLRQSQTHGSNHSPPMHMPIPMPNSYYTQTHPQSHSHSASPASQVQIMQRPRSRRPSMVETEPSPRLAPLEFDPVVTSYQLYNESARGRNPGVSATATPATAIGGSETEKPGPGVGGSMHPSASSPGFFLSRFRSFKGSRSRRHRRAESAGGRRDYGVSAEEEDGESEGAGGKARGEEKNREKSREKSKDKGERKSAGSPDPAPALAPGAGEEMARSGSGSGSGGIRLADGRVVEFGSPPLDAAVAAAEVERRKSHSASPGSRFGFGGGRRGSAISTRNGSGNGNVGGDVGLGILQQGRDS
ncbi:Uu.00g142810.m01.CDS01 [Anthostomella pinea]|uniref:Uu.00g142810.m01.CDS01 n=1 Tax=Anthostomella pinea TaxID=933095 RepID=A0AAI8VQL3_9PEZI|nr:Uu.00g142810.m01.CDS01 [Anthostomella pinea]